MNPETPEKHIPASIDRLIPRSPYNASNAAIAEKVREDILFLQDRIDRIKKLKTPNSTVLKTYQSMLESRQAVLQWLKENDDINEENLTTHQAS